MTVPWSAWKNGQRNGCRGTVPSAPGGSPSACSRAAEEGIKQRESRPDTSEPKGNDRSARGEDAVRIPATSNGILAIIGDMIGPVSTESLTQNSDGRSESERSGVEPTTRGDDGENEPMWSVRGMMAMSRRIGSARPFSSNFSPRTLHGLSHDMGLGLSEAGAEPLGIKISCDLGVIDAKGT
ncbi:hypothetical protein B0H17DRAFT_1149176 [Mycena rosella]|uniref:Uncharacterized protein n=1 Tax=Mycena rosella TaxID=1033263 RepID=A0AAD7C628_MYCRO|nr:hypothetical protein B0H17DRAFT_1149176 [Mycena rosella]